jgi:hypothetical protein
MISGEVTLQAAKVRLIARVLWRAFYFRAMFFGGVALNFPENGCFSGGTGCLAGNLRLNLNVARQESSHERLPIVQTGFPERKTSEEAGDSSVFGRRVGRVRRGAW